MVLVIKNFEDLKNIDSQLLGLTKSKKFNSKKHCGVLKLDDSPINIQNMMRDEWS